MKINGIKLEILGLISFRENLITVLRWLILIIKPQTEVGLAIAIEKRKLYNLRQRGFILTKMGRSNIIHFLVNKKKSTAALRRYSSDIQVFNQIIEGEEYKNLVDLILSKMEPSSIKYIIDGGANIGLTSIYFNRIFSSAKIHAIEPDRGNYIAMTLNFKLNELINIIPFQKAIWTHDQKLMISREFRDGQDWSITVSQNLDGKGIVVDGISIPELLELGKAEYIDILKLDIEGAERFLFAENSNPSVFLSKTKFIALEIHDEFGKRENIEHILSGNNFKLNHFGELTIGENLTLI